MTQPSSVRWKQKSLGLGFWEYDCCPISNFLKRQLELACILSVPLPFFFFFFLLEGEVETGTPSFNPESTSNKRRAT